MHDMYYTFQRAFWIAHRVFPGGGTCLEFGVFRGDTLVWQAEQMMGSYLSTRLIGFDSWQGLPEEVQGIWRPDRHKPGEYKSSRAFVQERIPESVRDRVSLIDGWFKDTLTRDIQSGINDLIFVNVDVDLYGSCLEVLNFIGPILHPGVIIYFDDWKDPNDQHDEPWGEHRAWAEWYPRNRDLSIELLESDAVNRRTMLVTKTPAGRLTNEQIARIRLQMLLEIP